MSYRDTPSMKGEEPRQQAARFDFGSALSIGVTLGLLFGMMVDNIGLGMVSGLNLAVLANALDERRRGEPRAGTAVVISIAALLFIIVMWGLEFLGVLS